MGSLYRRTVKFCTACQQRRVRTADWRACADAGHAIVIRERPVWWFKYHEAGQLRCVSAHSTKKRVAQGLLAAREGALAPVPIAPPISGLIFEVAGAANASINRDLIILKRMFTLAIQSEALLTRPYIPLLKENNVRRGFFEPAACEAMLAHLPVQFRGVVQFAYITGWRTPSEILPLEWRHVDLRAGEVRLDPGTTKNGEGRVFPFTHELRRALETQQALTQGLIKDGEPLPRYVFCYLKGQKAGQRMTDSGFNKAWRLARTAAGCPDRIPHDFRRTAVRNLVRAGVPERVAMQLTGHKTRAIFERYNIVNAGDLSEAAQRLDSYLISQTAAASGSRSPDAVSDGAPAGRISIQ